MRLAVVETFTGGAIADRFGEPGALRFPKGSCSPTRRLSGVSSGARQSLRGALDEPARLATALAETARSRFNADLALANVGVFRREEGKPEYKGESHTVIARTEGSIPNVQPLGGELPMVRERATILAIDFLRKFLGRVTVWGA